MKRADRKTPDLESWFEALPANPGGGLQILECMRDILIALQAMHDKGLVHCDFKLENVLHMSDGAFKVCDFGGVIEEGTVDPTGICSGSPPYIEPMADSRCRFREKGARYSGDDSYSFCASFLHHLARQAPTRGMPGTVFFERLCSQGENVFCPQARACFPNAAVRRGLFEILESGLAPNPTSNTDRPPAGALMERIEALIELQRESIVT